MNRIFYSKVDWWYYVLIAVMGGWMVYLFWIKEIIVAFIFMAITSFMIRMLTSMRYIVTSDDMLVIEYGLQFLKPVRIPLSDIVRIERKFNPISSPALSLDRIEVYFRKGKWVVSVCISPKNREDMVRMLQKRNGQISYIDNRK
ncbi:MAG: hypothetical protein E7097_01900 [Bacteroides sp.]|nr:hypothetical protein [Bacteroides sp.]